MVLEEDWNVNWQRSLQVIKWIKLKKQIIIRIEMGLEMGIIIIRTTNIMEIVQKDALFQKEEILQIKVILIQHKFMSVI